MPCLATAGIIDQIHEESGRIQSLLREETGCNSARVSPLTILDMVLWMSNGSLRELGLDQVETAHELATSRTWNVPRNPEQAETSALETTEDHREPYALGFLRIADVPHKPTTVFAGKLLCAQCSASIEIEVERNPNAVSAKQPAFVIRVSGATPNDKPIGQLFIGTILSSPILYYGSVNHCGHEQRITLFFNRALRDRSDHHMTIMKSNSGPSDTSSGDNRG